MASISRWAKASSVVAPIALIGGWTVAATRQSVGFDSTRDTISALAAHGAQDRWLMTSALVVTGACHLVTAAGLAPAASAGRVVLAVGGLGSLAVAAFPQGTGATNTPAHGAAAAVAFGALTVWPALAARAGQGRALQRTTAVAASTVLAAALGWFVVELSRDGDLLGLSERVLAGAQVLWPAAVSWASGEEQARAVRRWAGDRRP